MGQRSQKLFVKCDSKSLLILPQIQKLLKEEKVPDNKIREFIELPVADAYLISYAKTHNCILVTHEEPAYKINAKRKSTFLMCVMQWEFNTHQSMIS